MPLRKMKGKNKWRAISYSTGKPLGPKGGESKAKAESRSRTSKRRSKRKRHTGRKRRGGYY